MYSCDAIISYVAQSAPRENINMLNRALKLSSCFKLAVRAPLLSDFSSFQRLNMLSRVPLKVAPRGMWCQLKGVYRFASSHQAFLKTRHDFANFEVIQLAVRCLAIYSYLVISGKECVIIDIDNDVQHIVDYIKQQNLTLKGILLTHYHADYVAGHNELQKKFNSPIYMGPKSTPKDNLVVMKDAQEIKVGNILLRCIHSPGHTEESSCFLALDGGKQVSLFTGDTVFLNQVGRPDLAVKTDLTARQLAMMLYESIQKIKQLSPHIYIFPGHGSGSSCGKAIGSGDYCTLEKQLKNNYALKASNQQEFVDKVLQDMPEPPAYFPHAVQTNKSDHFDFQTQFNIIIKKEISIHHFLKALKGKQSVCLDIRSPSPSQIFIKGCVNIGSEGQLANWVGTLYSPTDKIILYGSSEECKNAITRLLRIGFTNVQGYFTVDERELALEGVAYDCPWLTFEASLNPGTTILDVRKRVEVATNGRIVTNNYLNIELQHLRREMGKLDRKKEYAVHCQSGYRAKIACSMLQNQGFENVKYYKCAFKDIFKDGKVKNTLGKVPL